MADPLHVLRERGEDARRIGVWSGERLREIEQVPAFAALIKCEELGGEELVELIASCSEG